MTFYYQYVSKRARVPKKKKRFTLKNDPEGAKRKLLLFTVHRVRQKLILLRQHKIKRDSFISKLIILLPEQAYLSFSSILKNLFINYPVRFARWCYQTRVLKAGIRFISNFYFVYRFFYNMFYYTRLTGMKLKFLWDTLDHYLLLKQICRIVWREKLISSTLLWYSAYFFYVRNTFFMRPDYIWLQDVTNRMDRHIRDRAKSLMRDEVFGNPDLPSKVAPLLVQLVQQPKIRTLMTDLFIILLRNKPFQDDAFRLVDKLIHDFLNSPLCERLFSNLIVEQVLRNKETVLPGLFQLLQNYLLSPSTTPMLEREGANILNHIL
jgi:hypothetical protein